MRNMSKRVTLVCALISAPLMAAAQTTTMDGAAATPAQTGQTTPAEVGPTGVAPMSEKTKAMPELVEGQIMLQSEDSILANDLIGLPVYSVAEESVGNINDIIVKFDGTVEGVVVGVGGFLGIGEKDVAIKLDKFDLATREDGEMRLVLDATREDLDAAPAFKTAREQKRETEAKQMQQKQDNGDAPLRTDKN